MPPNATSQTSFQIHKRADRAQDDPPLGLVPPHGKMQEACAEIPAFEHQEGGEHQDEDGVGDLQSWAASAGPRPSSRPKRAR